jgi:hypothetical protein
MTRVFLPFRQVSGGLRPVALDDRRRLPWRFLARHIALDALSPRL